MPDKDKTPGFFVVLAVVGFVFQKSLEGYHWYSFWSFFGGGLLAYAISLKETLKALSYILFFVAFILLPREAIDLSSKFAPDVILPIGLAFQFALIIQAGILMHIVKAREDSTPPTDTAPQPFVDPKIIRRKPGFPPPVDERSFYSEHSSRSDNEGHDP